MEIVHQGVLYRNPYPGHKAICAFLPNVVPLSEQELLCFCRIGQAFYSVDGKLAKLRSRDGGRTWLEEGLVWDPRNDEISRTYTAPHATPLKDGRLLLIAHRYPADENNFLRFNPETGGTKPTETVLFRSQDEGRTWSEPEILGLPGGGVVDTPSGVIELNDGRWFLACEKWKRWDDTSPLHIKGFALFSTDEGKTWGGSG